MQDRLESAQNSSWTFVRILVSRTMSLISLYGPDKALKNSGYFDYYVTLDNMFK